MRRVAIIDLGSNSARIAIFERTSRLGFYILGEFKMKVRLGEGAYENGGFLQDEAVNKCIAAFGEFKKIISSYKVTKVLCIGTSALRDAPNGRAFIDKIKKQFGINLRCIDGKTEAYLGGVAALNLLSGFDEATTIDIGGGSTELARIVDGKIVDTISLNLGTVRLKELFFDKRNLDGLDRFVAENLELVGKNFHSQNVIAIGGSLRAISNGIMNLKNYPLKIVHNFDYDFIEYAPFIDSIAHSTALGLKNFPIKKERYDTIREGAFIFSKTAKLLGAKRVFTSGVGIREGIFVSNLLGKSGRFPQGFNPSLDSLVKRFSCKSRSSVAKFSKQIFDVLRVIHGVDERYLSELVAASKLSRIGQFLGYYSKHSHSAYFVENGLNYGYTHAQKALIATIIKTHGKSSLDLSEYESLKSLLPTQNEIIWLSFILELAKTLDESSNSNLAFKFENLTLQIFGIKDDLLVKENIKRLAKPAIFAICFN